MERLNDIIETFSKKTILVLGDVMLDEYIWGDVTRISPEAPVPVVAVTKESALLGGAANVAANIVALGGTARLVGVVGEDVAGETMRTLLKDLPVLDEDIVVDTKRATTRKVRVVARSQQLVRYDYEDTTPASPELSEKLYTATVAALHFADVVVLSDYAKGVLTEPLVARVMALCVAEGKQVIVDPKPQHAHWFAHATIITPNHTEAHAMVRALGSFNGAPDTEGAYLAQTLESTILVTEGEKGMSLYGEEGLLQHIPTYARDVYDVVGAGDTSVAALALALAADATPKEAALIANHAAGITVGKHGTATVSPAELLESIRRTAH